ncbi:MAG TPA: hypothetical protein VKQ89_00195 [Candidatus Angelobacter sp.]|nr:hypothetical protein [Candidatus Angelobacter sp.]
MKLKGTPAIFVFVAALIAVVVFVFLWDQFNRKRIRRNIEARGGRVIEILRNWGSGSRSETVYHVSYLSAAGERVSASCKAAMLGGVEWTKGKPSGSLSDL